MSYFFWCVQGERLSHAVGCAFTICLEKKQQREKEKLSAAYNSMTSVASNGTSNISLSYRTNNISQSQRTGSFRQASLADRLTDPQSAIIAGNLFLQSP